VYRRASGRASLYRQARDVLGGRTEQ